MELFLGYICLIIVLLVVGARSSALKQQRNKTNATPFIIKGNSWFGPASWK